MDTSRPRAVVTLAPISVLWITAVTTDLNSSTWIRSDIPRIASTRDLPSSASWSMTANS